MKRFIVALILIALALPPAAAGQADTTAAVPAPALPWNHGLVAGLNMTQVGYTDWVQGGDNALAYATTLDGKSTGDFTTTTWETVYKLAFGQTRLGSQGLRKTDDKIDISSTLTYKLGTLINPYAGLTIKSQFAKGFIYDAAGTATPVSKFWDPGYLTQSAGVGYQPLPQIKTRFGLALREVFTSVFTGYADDPATLTVEKTSVDGGLEEVTEISWALDDNLLLTSKIEFFAPFSRLDEVVARGDNTLTAKVSKYVTVLFNVQFINEKKASPRTQLKETLAMGLSYAIF